MPTAVISTRWGEIVLHWPFEEVPVALEVVTPRELTTLEWVLERTLDEFPDAPPTLAEAAEELGLADPVFLRETLRELLKLRAIEQRTRADGEPEKELDLSSVKLTETGRELFRVGKIEGTPEHPRMNLTFDVLTGAHVASLPKIGGGYAGSGVMPWPLLDDAELPERTASLSVDRVRTCSRERGERYQRGETRIRSAEVIARECHHFWVPLRAVLSLSANGTVSLSGDLRPPQLTWLAEHAEIVIPGAELTDLIEIDEGQTYPLADAKWVESRAGLVSRSDLGKVIGELLDRAKREVVVHGCWDVYLDIRAQVPALAKRGVHCVLRAGPSPVIEHWQDRDPDLPGFCLALGDAYSDELPVAIVVDGEQALLAEPVTVMLPSKEEVLVVIGTRAIGARAQALRRQLLSEVPDQLAAWGIRNYDERARLAALFLGASPRFAAALSQPPGPSSTLARAEHFKRLGRWLKERPESTPYDFIAAARAALEGHFKSSRQIPATELRSVIDLADGLLPAEQLLEHLIAPIEQTPALIDPGPLQELEQIIVALRARSSFNAALTLPTILRIIEPCLSVPAEPRPVTAELVQCIGRLVGEAQARRWASGYSQKWGQPAELGALERWLLAHAAVGRLIGPEFNRAASGLLQRVVVPRRAQLTEPERTALQEAWSACALPLADLTSALRPLEPKKKDGLDRGGGVKKNKDKKRGGKR